ncbi:glycosyltransferase family 2 protein [Hymenobacter pini]|uniref:glycosyltransferase family 2 protein n=1 Tax=Hymenobacter pini TaxID=2880879 RepID=UPI001CF292D2|nr:glycosyltransferase family 2 protein [Hymenobacter pini]MCA8833437.1 glycosyltransferase family 2 protein [Hymenobacter pini]
MIQVSIVVINYNTFALTTACLESIIAHTHGVSYEIILVDNASVETRPAVFKERFPAIKLVASEKNLGFAGGNNLGIAVAEGEVILLLNSDTYLEDDAITKAYTYLKQHKEVGVVSTRLTYVQGGNQSPAQRFPSVRYYLIELLRLQKLLPKRTRQKLLLGAFFDHSFTTEADWVWGTFFMFRRELLQQLPNGKLNDDFFMYCEDIQWCWDIRKLGYQIHYYSDASVVHVMGGSSGKKNVLNTDNRKTFLQKNYAGIHYKSIVLLEKLLGIN